MSLYAFFPLPPEVGSLQKGNFMTRALLDKELHELDAQIIRLGSLVDEALGLALEALERAILQKLEW